MTNSDWMRTWIPLILANLVVVVAVVGFVSISDDLLDRDRDRVINEPATDREVIYPRENRSDWTLYIEKSYRDTKRLMNNQYENWMENHSDLPSSTPDESENQTTKKI